jgi:hypothetical protein
LGNFLLLLYWLYYVSLWLAPLLLLQCPWFSGLVFWWVSDFLHIPFTALELFDWDFFCFSLIPILFQTPGILSSTCSSLLEPVVFVWLKGLFISRISIWFFFLRLSISLSNSSFTFYVVIFNSYISPFIVSFASLWCLLKFSLSSFICLSFPVLYFWCFDISWVHLTHSG